MAAVPDDEGVYKTKMPLPEYKEDLTSIEVLIAETDRETMELDGEEYFEFCIVGKFVASNHIHVAIKKLGFEKFFTKIIKEYIKNNY